MAQIFGVNYDPKHRFKKLKKPKLNKEMLGRLMDHTDAHNRVVAKQQRAVISRTLNKLEKAEKRGVIRGTEKRAKLQVKDAQLRAAAASRKAQLRSEHFLSDSGHDLQLSSFQFSGEEMQVMRDEMRTIRAMSATELVVMQNKLIRALESRDNVQGGKNVSEQVEIGKKWKSSQNKEGRKSHKKDRAEKRKVDLNKLEQELCELKALDASMTSSDSKHKKQKCEVVVLSSSDDDGLEVVEARSSFGRKKRAEVIEVDSNDSECEIQSRSDQEQQQEACSEEASDDFSTNEVSDRWRMTS